MVPGTGWSGCGRAACGAIRAREGSAAMPTPKSPQFPEFAPLAKRGLSLRMPRVFVMAGLAVALVLVSAIGVLGLARALAADSTRTAQTPNAGGTHLALSIAAAQASATPTATAAQHPKPKPTATPTQAATGNGCTVTATDTSAEQSLLTILNQHRAAAGAAPLKLSAKLSAVSRAHSCDMYQHHYVGHTGSDGSSPLQRIQSAGLALSNWGENVGTASGLGVMGGIQQIDDGMMAEPLTPYDHHWNIVHAAFTQVGLGVIYVNGQVWVTEDFIG